MQCCEFYINKKKIIYSESKAYINERVQMQKQKYEVHFGEDDLWINGFRLNPVHIIPEIAGEITEADFYIDTGWEICLLRIRNNPVNKVTFCMGEITYIIVEKTLRFKIEKELEIITKILKKIKIPHNLKENISFSI